MIAEAQQDGRCDVQVCETLGEFEERVENARRGAADPPPG
jgi:hypothetical protein